MRCSHHHHSHSFLSLPVCADGEHLGGEDSDGVVVREESVTESVLEVVKAGLLPF